MRWVRRKGALHGYVEDSDPLEGIGAMACPDCHSHFESLVLHLDELAFVDSDGVAALATYCRELVRTGGIVTIRTRRPALGRLLEAGPVADFVDNDRGDDSGPGEAYTCPHR